MLNTNSIDAVNNSLFSKRFMKPLNDTYCFENIPGTVKYLLGAENAGKALPKDVIGSKNSYNKVVVLLIDGFGWKFFEKYKEHSRFISDAIERKDAVVSKLTTQFPTSTTSNITTMHTGMSVSQSGILEWFQYEPLIDDAYTPFLFNRAGEVNTDTLVNEGIKPEDILPRRSVYEDLKNNQINSYSFHYEYINESTYSSLISKDTEQIHYEVLSEGLEVLRQKLKQNEKAYYYFYYPDFDKYCHKNGPDSEEAETEIIKTLNDLDVFFETIQGEVSDTLFILTADHGLTSVVPERAIYLNKECPEILEHLKTKSNGDYIAPCGGFRNMFLHVKEGKVNDVKEVLSKQLHGKAEVFTIPELLDEGIFGSNEPSPDFLRRVGDLVILSYKDEAVWWYEEEKFSVNILGQHGGLTKEEIEIPFVVSPFK
ncbi:alkaline phosphatase family protein [Haloplasma contractile]|uniref:Type I phosphodiesterase-nucleotide pyrophosphatase protein n=1 Tax=Haloplasma contractile SSD-17B TaxID=1033810 RepID=F7PWC1_9MOLU|nr:alkaline phosphatase family protein [Haloplasma contractile]ERJ10900.1 Type I phosphodiesterase-nucleotide pyrophosphatase protein [Haloplasma contractile SSD-17B]